MEPRDAPGLTDYKALAARMGYGALRTRLKKQAGLWAKETHQGMGIFVVEAVLPVDRLIDLALRVCGLRGIGLRSLLDVRIIRNDLEIPGLPPEFDGFRLLQLTDLHCDLHPPLIDVVCARLAEVEYDAAVFTGDYHNKIGQPADASLALMRRVLAAVRAPRFGVLGNHDFVEKVAFLEASGLRLLLNESEAIERGGRRLWMTGIDDPHFFRADDLVRAMGPVPRGEPVVLLSHSPEPCFEAARMGCSAMLCGHTHGGQICLPGGIPIVRNTRAPRRMLVGPWQVGPMRGYTSRGTGGCGVAARLFSHGEITLHTLRAPRT